MPTPTRRTRSNMRKARMVPAPSPRILAELLDTLPPHLSVAVRTAASFQCLSREMQELDAALSARDRIEQTVGSSASGAEPLVLREAMRREARAFMRASIVASAIVDAAPATVDSICLALIVTIAAGQPGPADAATFPWRQLRQVLAAVAEL